MGIERIALATDFGCGGPYLGQVRLLLGRQAPGLPVEELISDLPRFRPQLAAYLLPALVRDVPTATLYLCVVDPGVGGDRGVLAVEVGEDRFVGPDNGLLALVARTGRRGARCQRVDWEPKHAVSASFQGRDLFAPLAVRIARGEEIAGDRMALSDMVGADWPDDVAAVIYKDYYGNLITGLRAACVAGDAHIRAGEHMLARARTFGEVAIGRPFWYENAFGLVELAVNRGSAERLLGLELGDPVKVVA